MLFELICAALPFSSPVSMQDSETWGRFRGPNGSGVAAGSNALPDAIGPDDNLAWRAEIPPGYSSPVVTDEYVFVTGVDDTQLLVFCLDRTNGDEVWLAETPDPLDAPHKSVNSPAAPTPVTDGTNVYVFFDRTGLLSYDADGDLRWRFEFEEFKTPYGMGTSPVIAGDLVVMQCDHDAGSFLIAIDKDTGEQRWRTARPGTTHGFSSPIVYEPQGGRAEVIVSGSYQVAGYALETGEKLWWVTGMAWQAKTIPVIGDDTLYVHSWMASPSEFGVPKLQITFDEAKAKHDTDGDGALSKEEVEELKLGRVWFLYDLDDNGGLDEEEWGYAVSRSTAVNGLYAIRLGGRGDVTADNVLWRYRRALPNIPSPLLYDGLLYLLKEGGIFTVLDPESGKSVDSGRIEGAQDTYYASPIAGDGKIITASQEGRVAVLKPGEDWKVLEVREFDEEIWATPAIASGQVFVRTLEALYCFESSAQDSGSAEWPNWRGPARDGLSTDASWSVTAADEPLWTRDVGLGYSAVSVADGRLYTMGFDKEKQLDSVLCLDPETGETLWSHEYKSKIWAKMHGGGTLTTPTVDGDTVYTMNREGNVYAFDAKTGDIRWHVDAVQDFGVQTGTWGFAASPIVSGDELLLNFGKIVSLDKSDGDLLNWESKDYGHSYSTPALFDLDGKPVMAVFNSEGLAVIERGAGEELYFREWKTKYDINAATPIIDGKRIFISSGLNHGAAMLELGDDDMATVWESRVMRNKMSGCVRIGDFLYGYDEAILKCIDLDGNEMWMERGLGNGAVTGAGDRLLVMTGEGELLVLAANAEEFEVLSRRQVIEDGGVYWTMPVLVNGLVYCRGSRGTLVCLDHRTGS